MCTPTQVCRCTHVLHVSLHAKKAWPEYDFIYRNYATQPGTLHIPCSFYS